MRFALFGCLGIGPDDGRARKSWVIGTVGGWMVMVFLAALGTRFVLIGLRNDRVARSLVRSFPNPDDAWAAFRRVKDLGAERAAAGRIAELLEADRKALGKVGPTVNAPRRALALQYIQWLGRDAEAAIPELRRTLDMSQSEIYRVRAVGDLRRLADKDVLAYEALRGTIAAPSIPLVGDPVRASYWAAYSLASLKSEPRRRAAIPGLIEVVDRGDAHAREAAVHALGFLGVGSKEMEGACLKGLGDPNPNNRAEAARTLGAFGPLDGPIPEAIGKLRDDPVESVRSMAREAMVSICRRREARSDPSTPVSPRPTS